MKTILFCLLILPTFLLGQINESDTLSLKASVSLTGFYQGGNVETFIFRAKSDLSFKPWKKWVFKNQNSFVYQEFGNTKADNDVLSLNFLYLNPERNIYPFVLGFVSTNYRREIDLRYLFGGGATFQILNKNENWLKLSISSEYEHTSFAQTNFNYSDLNGNKRINTIRSTIWVNGKYHLFKKKIIFNHECYFQPSIQDRNNFRWQADFGLEMPIVKFLNFKINYRHTYESVVVTDQKPEDNVLTFGFTLKSF